MNACNNGNPIFEDFVGSSFKDRVIKDQTVVSKLPKEDKVSFNQLETDGQLLKVSQGRKVLFVKNPENYFGLKLS